MKYIGNVSVLPVWMMLLGIVFSGCTAILPARGERAEDISLHGRKITLQSGHLYRLAVTLPEPAERMDLEFRDSVYRSTREDGSERWTHESGVPLAIAHESEERRYVEFRAPIITTYESVEIARLRGSDLAGNSFINANTEDYPDTYWRFDPVTHRIPIEELNLPRYWEITIRIERQMYLAEFCERLRERFLGHSSP